MIPEQCVWLLWSSAFLVPWLAAYAVFSSHRTAMVKASLYNTPFGLTVPLSVPEHGGPPSLFDLALRTGFDIESLIFSFGIGGIGAVLYNPKQFSVLWANERMMCSRPVERLTDAPSP